jgi:type III secretion protein V
MAGVPKRLAGELPALAPAMLLALMLACVLVPLPQWLVDLLLSGSLAFSVLLLVAALRVDVPARFSVFPRLLLLVTAFRLVLNLATTRLILAEADAGQVIDAFAGFVTRGDLIVGVVMFGIVTAIQYLVIARGTERVAEVGARFALDGMPGRQAAIAADLQGGTISADEAVRRRAELDRRSDFYGAMDGAVKFVKNDAVVGLIIVAVNLVGGLAIGLGRLDYSVGESLEIYGRLAIGDGLLAQIPAVLVSLAAGVLVSRIETGHGEREGRWLEPAMLLVPASLLLGVALVPGMPNFAFAFVGLTLFAAAWVATARAPRAVDTAEGLRLRLPAGLRTEDADASLASLRVQCHAALGFDIGSLELESGAAPGQLELWRGARRLAVEGLDASEASEARWLVGAYSLITRHASRLLSLGRLEAEMRGLREHDAAALRIARERLTLPDLLDLQRSFLDAAIPLPPLWQLIAAIAEGRVFADADERPRWGQRLREATASSWLPAVLEAHARRGRPRYLDCSPDLLLAIEDCTRVEQGRFRCTLTAGQKRQVREALMGSEAGLVVTATSERARVSAFFSSLQPRVPVLARSEFESAGLEAPACAQIDEEGLVGVLDAAA